jgi:hypothetical protein
MNVKDSVEDSAEAFENLLVSFVHTLRHVTYVQSLLGRNRLKYMCM